MADGSDAGTNGNESSKGRTDAVVALRKQLGLAMVKATGWAEQHRRQLAAGSLLGVACEWRAPPSGAAAAAASSFS